MKKKEPLQNEETVEVTDNRELLKKLDKQENYRETKGYYGKIIVVMSIVFSIFQLWANIFNRLDSMMLRLIHLSFGLCLIFLLYPARKKWSREKWNLYDVIFAVLGAAVPMYFVIFYKDIVLRAGTVTTLDFIVGLLAVILVLEATRRIIGWPMVILALIFILYGLFGRYMPGQLAHRGLDFPDLIQHQFYSMEGILGIPIGVSATYIFLFLIFGAFLEKSGMGKFFIDLANAAAGGSSGGPAKVAVISSACMGTLTGSTTANVVGTGSFTIPMMKKLGYSPEFAGAVEAAASTGGQIMPPIMGAAAFLMAEFTNTPYVNVAIAAAIPAILYYFGIMGGVHFEAKKLNLKGLSKDELPIIKDVIKEGGHLILPLVAIFVILIKGYTPTKAAVYALLLTILCAAIKKSTRMSLRDIMHGLEVGARSALPVIAACACAGVIIGVITQTGLGLKFGSILMEIAKGNLFLTLLFTALTSLILGMGVPTTPNYVITTTIAAPALVGIGTPVLVAHMFVFYYGIISDITPPVCIAAVAGAGIAKSDPMKTGIVATRLAVAAFLVPFIFVYNPILILLNGNPLELIWIIVSALVGIICISSALSGYLIASQSMIERFMLGVAGLLTLIPGLSTDIFGILLLVVVYLIQRKKVAKNKIAEL
ncbi:MAG: TRAP transporter permease [Clostridiaceae bacterium]|nr:TRAP transporter permease [Clostridiaceae bacterium]